MYMKICKNNFYIKIHLVPANLWVYPALSEQPKRQFKLSLTLTFFRSRQKRACNMTDRLMSTPPLSNMHIWLKSYRVVIALQVVISRLNPVFGRPLKRIYAYTLLSFAIPNKFKYRNYLVFTRALYLSITKIFVGTYP